MSAYGLFSGCAHVLLSMWVNAYFFSAIYNEHWALISFSDIFVPTCHCFCGYTLTFPPPCTLPYYPRHNIPRVLSGHNHWGGTPPLNHGRAAAKPTISARQRLTMFVCLLLRHYLSHAPPKTRPPTHTTPLLAPHFPPIFLLSKPSNTPFFLKYIGPRISTQVRHHTHLDMSTCRACSVKHMMIMRQYFPRLWYDPYPLHARGLGLCLVFSALVCDLLSRRLFDGFC